MVGFGALGFGDLKAFRGQGLGFWVWGLRLFWVLVQGLRGAWEGL